MASQLNHPVETCKEKAQSVREETGRRKLQALSCTQAAPLGKLDVPGNSIIHTAELRHSSDEKRLSFGQVIPVSESSHLKITK